MSSAQERDYISNRLMPALRKKFDLWAKEYQQERDLGALGEFANLYRKARKLKTLMWPGENNAHGLEWREPQRVIVEEVAAHALLLLLDLDKLDGTYSKWLKDREEDEDLDEDEEEERFTPQGRRANRITRREARLRDRPRSTTVPLPTVQGD